MSLKNELRKNINIWQIKQFEIADKLWNAEIKDILLGRSLTGKQSYTLRVINGAIAQRLSEIAENEGISAEYTACEIGNAVDVLFKW